MASSRAEDPTDAEGGFPPSVSHTTPYAEDEEIPVLATQGLTNERAPNSNPGASSPTFPLSHVLHFGSEAKGKREALGAELSVELMVPGHMAVAALEAFGVDSARAREWLQANQVRIPSTVT